jgi:hypothetical protein
MPDLPADYFERPLADVDPRSPPPSAPSSTASSGRWR